jgi:hypothetical protein
MNDFDIFATKITTKIGKSQLKLVDDLKQINNEVTDTHVALDRARHDAQEQCILSKQQAHKNISLQEKLEKTNAVVRARDDALQKTAVASAATWETILGLKKQLDQMFADRDRVPDADINVVYRLREQLRKTRVERDRGWSLANQLRSDESP